MGKFIIVTYISHIHMAYILAIQIFFKSERLIQNVIKTIHICIFYSKKWPTFGGFHAHRHTDEWRKLTDHINIQSHSVAVSVGL